MSSMTKHYVEEDRVHPLEGEGPWTPEQIGRWLSEGEGSDVYWYSTVVAGVVSRFPDLCRNRWGMHRPPISYSAYSWVVTCIVREFREVAPLLEEFDRRGFEVVGTEEMTDGRKYKLQKPGRDRWQDPTVIVNAYPVEGEGKCVRVRDYERDQVTEAYRWVCGESVPGVEVEG